VTRHRRWPRILGGVILVLVALALFSVPSALSARRSMLSGRDALARAQNGLAAGDFEQANAAFTEARASFESASRSASNLVLRIEGWVPLLGSTPDALRDLAAAGEQVATAGVTVTNGISALPDGLASLAPKHRRIPIGTIETLAAGPVSEARSNLEQAQRLVDSIHGAFVLGPVSEATLMLRDKLERVLPLARSAEALLEALPEFAGKDGVKRYFVAAQNPAELRGSGGFLGAWSLLTLKDGRINLARFRDIGTLPDTYRIPPAMGETAYLYGNGITGSWKLTNQMPDAPTAAGLIEDLWKRTHRSELNGVVFVDPQALAYLLQATGPVDAPSLGTTLTAGNVVSFVTNKAYFVFEGSTSIERKLALGLAAEAVWRQFLDSAPTKQGLDALIKAASGGYLVLHSTDPLVEQALAATGAAGEWRPAGGDFFGVSVNNGAGNKVDFYMHRDVRYEVALGEDGTANARAQVVFTSDAPAGEPPSYALGPYGPGVQGPKLGPGENYSIVQTYCAPVCDVSGATLDGKPMDVGEATEQGLTLFVSAVTIQPQQTRTLGYSFSLGKVWEGDRGGGTYRLRMLGQPTVKRTTASVSIQAPHGTRFTWASEGVQIAGSTATWSGDLGKRVDLMVGFSQPFLPRMWTRVTDFLGKPVIKL